MAEGTEYFSFKSKKVKLLSPQFIYAKLLLIYTSVYTLAFVIGCVIFHIIDVQKNTIYNAHIQNYFDVEFENCESIYDYARQLLSINLSDISHLVIIFALGFTMFSAFAISVLLLYRGFAFGFSISYFTYAIKYELLTIGNSFFAFVLYSVLAAITAALIIIFSVKTSIFSDDFKDLCGRPGRIIRSKALYMQIFRFLIAFGGIILLNLLRCLF